MLNAVVLDTAFACVETQPLCINRRPCSDSRHVPSHSISLQTRQQVVQNEIQNKFMAPYKLPYYYYAPA